jgi:hypothetical protein
MKTEILTPLRVVARFVDGRLLKGTTRDFSAGKPVFHVFQDEDMKSPPIRVLLADLKAVYFVRSLTGDKDHHERLDLDASRGQGRPLRVTFHDGEVSMGFTVGYAPDRPGFFLVPVDPDSNNLRVFVVRKAVAKVEFLTAEALARK